GCATPGSVVARAQRRVFRESLMKDQRALVAYGSRLGSTAGVASRVAETLTAVGSRVDLLPIAETVDVGRYDRVILGSPIRYDRWLPEAVWFAEAHRAALSARPVHAFFTCLVLARRTPAAEEKSPAYAQRVAELLPDVTVQHVGRFAGALDSTREPWPERWLLRLVSAFTGVAEGDDRDASAVRAWALRLGEAVPGADGVSSGVTLPGERRAASFPSSA
ncbi:MAG: flavodoxin domain-containing protein, partial [Acidobacteriota bacterium]